MAATLPRDKYFLRSIQEDIALYDRKLAHLIKYESFASEKERNTAAAKIAVKRGQLIRHAQQLAEEGIEYEPSKIAQPLRSPEELAAEARTETADKQPSVRPVNFRGWSSGSSHEGGVLNFRNEIGEYLAKRRKRVSSGACA